MAESRDGRESSYPLVSPRVLLSLGARNLLQKSPAKPLLEAAQNYKPLANYYIYFYIALFNIYRANTDLENNFIVPRRLNI